MDSFLIGISTAAFSFCLGYGFRRLSLKWENQAKKAERQAALHAEQLQATVSASLDGIIVISATGDVLEFSESAEHIFGYNRDDIIGQPMADLIVPERYRDAHNNGMKRMRDTGVSKILGQRIEIEAMRADGSEFMSELAISRSSGEKGDIFIAYIRDISDRIARQNDLVNAKEAAEAASEAKSRFLATMSHEIRTPFNAVLGILDILGDTKLNKEQRHLVKTAESSSVALLRVINDVLDYARMSSGQNTLHVHPFQANAVFDDVIRLFEVQAEDKSLKLELITDPKSDSIHLEGDIGRIRQILMNFVSNAIKFTDQGDLKLKIELNPDGPEQQRLKCSVSDSGIGINQDQMENLFDEFFMVDNSETREYEGTGLGLTISKGLAELMGGELGCESEVGQGSTFWVSIPLPATSASAVNDRYKQKDIDMENCRILVAEDNVTNQMVISHILENRCAKFVIVENGEEALEALENEVFDIILMDIYMPKMTGKEATRLIRASNNRHRNIPIIALTAMGSFQDLDALKLDGIDEVVTKPFKKEDLFAAISSVIAAKKMSDDDGSDRLEFGGFAHQLDDEDIPIFLDQLRSDLEDIYQQYLKASGDNDWENLSGPSHTLKGLAGTYGMTSLAELADRTYIVVRSENHQTCSELTNRTINTLKKYLNNLDRLFDRAKDAA